MQALLDFFSTFASVIGNLIDFVIDFIEQIIGLIALLAEAAVAIPMVFLVLPPPATVALTSILAIAIIYKTLGRE